MVDHFSDLTYVHITISKNQEETLAWKSAFKIWASTSGVKSNRYHEENEIYSEQPFRSALEDSNQKIAFLGLDLIIKISLLKGKFKL